jgi:ribosome-binding factor A
MKQAPKVAGQRSQQESNMRHKRSTPNRSNRVNDQIQRDVAELIRDLKDPRIGNMVTITNVEVTPDYAHAKVYFSLLVGDPKACEEGLNEAAGFIRNGLFKRLQIHTVPTLHFHFDRTTERPRMPSPMRPPRSPSPTQTKPRTINREQADGSAPTTSATPPVARRHLAGQAFGLDQQ